MANSNSYVHTSMMFFRSSQTERTVAQSTVLHSIDVGGCVALIQSKLIVYGTRENRSFKSQGEK